MELTELLVPNFVKYLEEHGDVIIIDDIPFEENQQDMPNPTRYLGNRERIGRLHLMTLNGNPLGYLTTYDNPNAIFYDGKVPGFSTNLGERIGLIYYSEQFGIGPARGDCWEEIPFP